MAPALPGAIRPADTTGQAGLETCLAGRTMDDLGLRRRLRGYVVGADLGAGGGMVSQEPFPKSLRPSRIKP